MTPPSRSRAPKPVALVRRALGSGPPLVLVHGTAADTTAFRRLEPLLMPHFTVVAVERRGRRGSGDTEEYSLEAEFADLAAVLETLDEPIVFGHSFGANVALGAALDGAVIGALVLYEPGRRRDLRTEVRREVAALVAGGDRTAALRLALREFSEFPEEWLDELLETAPWQERLGYAHTIARELEAYDAYDYGDISRLDIPTLFLVGERSPETDRNYAHELAARLPRARVAVLAGEGHDATMTAPDLVAREIMDFAFSVKEPR